MRRCRPVVLVPLFAALLLACGDDGPGGLGGGANYTATIDGVAWQSDEIFFTVNAGGGVALPGSLVISGQSGATGDTRGVMLILGFIEGPGTYPLGANNVTTAGGTGGVFATSGTTTTQWLTPLSGSAGSITLSSVSGGRLAGTFSFTAAPIVGGGANVSVTNGSFDTTLPSNFVPVAGDERGGRMSATMNGSTWVAATNIAVGTPGAYGVSGANDLYDVIISTIGTTPGSYAVGTEVTITVTQVTTGARWGASGSTGTVTITGGGTTRSIGTFSGTLTPQGSAPGNMVITNGSFDIKLP